jgi:integrase/recombinase XerD
VLCNVNGGEKASRECPNCHSKRNWKDGIREIKNREIQRFICRDCGFRFSDNSYKLIGTNSNRQICVLETKNLETATEIKTVAGENSVAKENEAEKEYRLYLRKQGYSKATVATRVKLLKLLKKKGANILNSETVKTVIADSDCWSNGHKQVAVQAYNSFAKMMHIKWEPPCYKHIKSLPFIPSEEEIDALIAGMSKKVAASLQLLKETGMRIGEAWNLRWTDIDQERSTIRCRAEKHGNPREFKVSAKLLGMLNMLPKRNEYVFAKASLNGHRWSYEKQRKRLAVKLQNPRLNEVKFHTFRHWYATREYAKTNVLLHVQERLGHRNINSTMVYTHLIKTEGDNYYSAIAKTTEEAQRLVENGFSFVCITPENIMLFRKPK